MRENSKLPAINSQAQMIPFRFLWLPLLTQPVPEQSVVVGLINVYVGAVPRTARNFRRVQGNAPYIGRFVIL
jgi:hypothetical protein